MPTFFNRTRSSRSLELKLLRQGRPLGVLVYWLVRWSDLGREGIENSGSYRFADHIYRNEPSGRGKIGRWLDKTFLAMPAVKSFRNRFLASRDQLCEFLTERSGQGKSLDVLSAPCGIPRELADGARLFRQRTGRTLDGVTFHGIDLDAGLLAQARQFAEENGLPNFITHHGDALERTTYPEAADFITCTGLAEFISDEQLEAIVAHVESYLYANCETEIDSAKIGELVMERLAHVDQVAYVRFASVYRRFKDVRDFVDELQPMLKRNMPPR